MVVFHTSDHKILSYNLNITKDTQYSTDTTETGKRMNIIDAQEELQKTEFNILLNGTVTKIGIG